MAAIFDFVVSGTGVAGLACARYLARAVPTARIALVSAHPPMVLTSSLSTECFRDHWPSGVMRDFVQRSIHLMESHAAEASAFKTTRAGYLYVSCDRNAPRALLDEALACHGPRNVRVAGALASAAHAGPPVPHPTESLPPGADVYTDGSSALAAFPFLAPGVSAALHARNAGWVSAQTMGMDMYDGALARCGRAGEALTTMVRGRVVGADVAGGALRAVVVEPSSSGSGGPVRLVCGAFINAGGPFLASTHLAVSGGGGSGGSSALPVFNEVHSKVIFRDVLGAIPRDAPMSILVDAAAPLWHEGELEHLAEAHGQAAADRAGAVMAGGAHFRPYGGAASDAVLLLWEAWHHGVRPPEPPPDSADALLDHALYPEVALRGLARLVPGLGAYFDPDGPPPGLRPPAVDGGYYCRTTENVPLVGPAPAPGGSGGALERSFLCGALSGYGVMAAHAAGELAAAWATGASSLPPYAPALSPLRHQDAEYMRPGGGRDRLLAGGSGQL